MNGDINDEITRVAYELYVKSGRVEGNDLLNWLAAEKIVRFERMLLGKQDEDAVPLLKYQPMEESKKKVRRGRPAAR
ncbi:MAG: hypothetical protein A4E73_02021 [Syntrophaceae bacterium PtaU1.Bin231]|nr:MAG: hypothetical protein A4E73_02021 [Syntrophaceae bacterium PtaU1.Bin231]HOG18556.1 DUF2934 domain-containing protein [Syntrophales bacterium]